MIPFGPGDIPASSEQATSRLSATLAQLTGNRQIPVTVQMEAPDRISELTIDMTNIEGAGTKLERPQGFVTLGDVFLNHLKIDGHPTRLQGAPVDFLLEANRVPFSWARDSHGNIWLAPSQTAASSTGEAHGQLEISAGRTDLENAIRAAATQAAEQQGAKLKDLKLDISSPGPRAITARIDVAASKFMMTARMNVFVDVAVDDALNLKVNSVDVKGDGAAGGMVASMLEPKLAQVRGKSVNLGQFMFAGARLTRLDLTAGDKIRLSAAFG